MGRAILLAVAAGIFTAVSSICQRYGAAQVPTDGFSAKLIVHLAREPIWLVGLGSMILGFACQATALHFGSLALVQPILASELLFVFAYLAVISSRRVRRTDWLAAGAMAAGLGVFLFSAGPSGGRPHASGALWLVAGAAGLGAVVVVTAGAYWPRRGGIGPSAGRQAGLLGVATGVSWGFLAAVIQELGSHAHGGVTGLVSTWSLYVLVIVGAASMILSSNALRAGPLAASQPGFTIVDPLVASLLGIFVFRNHLELGAANLIVEVVALATLAAGVVTLSRSSLIQEGPADQDRSRRIAPRAMVRPKSK